MKKEIFLLVVGVTVLSCIYRSTNQKQEKNNPSSNQAVKSETDLNFCMPKIDTIIDGKNAINLVPFDTFYTVKIKVEGIDTSLSYKFNCLTAKGLVPTLYSFYEGTLCLIAGSGFDYRQFTIAYAYGNKVKLKDYETALATDLKNDLVVYKDYDHPEKLIVQDFKTDAKKEFIIPSKFTISEIPEAVVEHGKVQLRYSNGIVQFSIR